MTGSVVDDLSLFIVKKAVEFLFVQERVSPMMVVEVVGYELFRCSGRFIRN